MKQKIIAALLALLLVLQLLACSSCAVGAVQIYDRNGDLMVTLKNANIRKNDPRKPEQATYIEVALKDAIELLIEKENLSEKQAKNRLFKGKFQLYTAFDPAVFVAVQKAYEPHRAEGLEFGCAVTDLNGRLLAAFSASKTDVNRAADATAPYSAFKPLSVYAPAIDAGVADWSKVYMDAPVKQIPDKTGALQDWPANPTGSYTRESTTVQSAIRQSLNTVAVRCLQDYGVIRSMQQLKKNYGISLHFEENKAATLGEEEILGNIALGYLNEGVSPIDMAGYYQSFAKGGSYTAPKAILRLSDPSGSTIYEADFKEKQVMKESTAGIMNHLLQGVTATNGTGAEAALAGIPVAGKTGTGEEGNWFVGVTPQYSCAVWHGNEWSKNRADELFATAVSCFPQAEIQLFPLSAGIKKGVFCPESGLLFSKNCSRSGLGYYAADALPTPCQQH